MATAPSRKSVTDTATRLDPGKPCSLLVRNEGTADIYLGESGVTTSTGTVLKVGESCSIDLRARDRLYGIAASGSHAVHVLAVTL